MAAVVLLVFELVCFGVEAAAGEEAGAAGAPLVVLAETGAAAGIVAGAGALWDDALADLRVWLLLLVAGSEVEAAAAG